MEGMSGTYLRWYRREGAGSSGEPWNTALNPRVRGSSPWRRTRSDLGFHCSRSFYVGSGSNHVAVTAPRSLSRLSWAPPGPGASAGACAVGRVRLPGLPVRGSGYPEEFLHLYDEFFTCRKKVSG